MKPSIAKITECVSAPISQLQLSFNPVEHLVLRNLESALIALGADIEPYDVHRMVLALIEGAGSDFHEAAHRAFNIFFPGDVTSEDCGAFGKDAA